MAETTLTLENFEDRCRPAAELLEARLHSYIASREDWDLAVQTSNRFLVKGVEGKGPCMGLVLPAIGPNNGWDLPLLPLRKKEVGTNPARSQS